jgi:transcriptional regulator with XRE-family HTH domain
MQAQRLSPEDLAKRSGVGRQTVYAYLAGRVENPRGDTMKRLAKAVETTAQWLREGDGPVDATDYKALLARCELKLERYESALRLIRSLADDPAKVRMIADAALEMEKGRPD